MPPDLTHAELVRAVDELTADIARSIDLYSAHAREMAEEAADTSRVADVIGALKVDTATIGETSELAKLMGGLEAGAGAYIAAGDFVIRRARAAQDQNTASHTGIGEAAHRSPVGREIFEVNRGWLRQE